MRLAGWGALAVGWRELTAAAGLAWVGQVASAVAFVLLMTWGHLSGEWVVGGTEAKVPAYACVMWGLGRLLRHDWPAAWLALGVGGAFHILVGGWSLLAAGLVRLSLRPIRRVSGREIAALCVGAGLALGFGLVPAWRMNADAAPAILAAADTIYVCQRLSHHLYFWDFGGERVLAFALLVLAWRELKRGRRVSTPAVLERFAIGALIACVAGIGLSTLDRFPAAQAGAHALLKLYWFRLADFALPALVAVQLGSWIGSWGIEAARGRIRARVVFALSAAALLVGMAVSSWSQWREGRGGADRQSLPTYAGEPERTRATWRNWRRICAWVGRQTPAGSLVLTPRDQQTFKWYAGRPEYVNWKDVPQNATALLGWAERMAWAYGGGGSEPVLGRFAAGELALELRRRGIRYWILEQRVWEEWPEPLRPAELRRSLSGGSSAADDLRRAPRGGLNHVSGDGGRDGRGPGGGVTAGQVDRHISGDEPRRTVVREEGPRPLHQDDYAVAELGDFADVDHQPDEPREPAAELETPGAGDGAVAADDGHASAVAIMESFGGLPAGGVAADCAGDESSLLHGDGSQGGEGLAVGVVNAPRSPITKVWG